MTKTARDLLKKALELSEGDRVRLAQTLLESVGEDDDHELSDDWRAELERRVMDEPQPGKPWATADQLLAKLESAQRRDQQRGKHARGA
jgi:putative addiction module component (TIGR02574 family)